MNKIAFLSMDDLGGYVADDHLTEEPLARLGWQVETISWRQAKLDWSEFAAVIIRTTWDYHKNLPAFLQALERIDAQTKLANSLPLVRWNADKTYLRELEAQGVEIARTIWGQGRIAPEQIEGWLTELQTAELVIKPTISGGAEDTWRLAREQLYREPEIFSTFADRQYMVQPFISNILDEGEFSLFYFGGEYSHTIQKTPKPADFRVQEEHGGLIRGIQPTPELLTAGEKTLKLINPKPLYARADFVRVQDKFALMELELIEPSLYLRMDEDAPHRFARAINSWLSG